MNKNTAIITVVVITVIVAGALFAKSHRNQAPSAPANNATDTAIRAQVVGFGSKLKTVSLLAPKETLAASLQSEYGAYVAPELLAAWAADPSLAIGRSVSSPWPERIQVGAVTKLTDGTYRADGTVIEVTSADQNGMPAATYPITLTLAERNGTWLITSATKGAYSELPSRVAIDGTWECLPHKNASGPQTLECAFGIKKDGDGTHYAVDTSLMSAMPVDFPTGAHVHAEGMVVPANQLNSNAWQRYNIIGILSATTIAKI